jgi:hypothetical protein
VRESPEQGRHTVLEIERLLRGSGKVQKGRTPASRHALTTFASASNSKGASGYPCVWRFVECIAEEILLFPVARTGLRERIQNTRKERKQFVKRKENHHAPTYQLGRQQSEAKMPTVRPIRQSGYGCGMLNSKAHSFLRSHLRFLSEMFACLCLPLRSAARRDSPRCSLRL